MKHAEQKGVVNRVLVTLGCVGLWTPLSMTTVMYNKYILSYSGFPYPIALTLWHMFFCSMMAAVIVFPGFVEPLKLDLKTYVKAVAPIGFCFAGSLWLGNAAYMLLSVSFVQTLKAITPVVTFTLSTILLTEQFSAWKLCIMVIISAGVMISSYGELNFVAVGVAMQLISLSMESLRLVLVQLLLQSRGMRLNPVTTLAYVAPCCFLFLLLPFAVLELPRMMADEFLLVNPRMAALLLGNAVVVSALNMAVFLLIGNTSALTMNVAGVVKDCGLITLSSLVYRAPVTVLNVVGYAVSFFGIATYNFLSLRAMKAAAPVSAKQVSIDASGVSVVSSGESVPLLPITAQPLMPGDVGGSVGAGKPSGTGKQATPLARSLSGSSAGSRGPASC